MNKTPKTELDNRLKRFKNVMDLSNSDWKMAVIFSKINLFYFTGTMQDGILLIPRNEKAVFWVRRSYERALDESRFPEIKHMNSFRDAAKNLRKLPDTVYLETEKIPLALYQRFNKHFPFKNFKPLDMALAKLRSVKSPYELSMMKKSGKIHQHVLEDIVPEMLREGMSEAQLGAELFPILIGEGNQGLTRFGMFDTEILLGHIGFGINSLYPSYFDGASGNKGLSPSAPVLGSRDKKLNNGDLVFLDIGCAYEGYNTDKTMTYMFGHSLPQHALDAHGKCVEIQNEIASQLKPGAIPSEIYTNIMNDLEPDFLENFMGFEGRRVKFLGHGIGLLIDELPVIAEKFNEPLEKGMVFAIEPKKGIDGIGMVGIENTFIVTSKGGSCITGDNPGLIPVFKS